MTTRNFIKRFNLKPARFCALSLAILFTGLGSPAAAPQEPWFGALGNGKFDGWRDIVSAMALPFVIFTGCSSPAGSPPNVAPTASAGSDQNITLPTDSVTLDGGASSDSDGNIASYEWTHISKPSGAPDAVISAPAGSSTSVSGLTAVGKYTFQLKVTDNDGAESTDAVDVTVAAAANVAPTANAGSDLSINVSTASSVTLDGSASGDSDGSIAAYEWTLLSKPNGAPDVTINNSTSATATASNLTKIGIYKFQLKVTDNAGAENVDAVNVTVKETKTADVSVAANNFSAGPTLDFTPVYSFTGVGASYFNATDITYTLSSVQYDDAGNITNLNNYNGVVPSSIYTVNKTYVFTQIFYSNGQEIGSRSVVGVVAGSGSFSNLYNNTTDWTSLSAIPAADFQISKEVSE
jgi:ribosomal protein L14